jgi:ubiquinone/menaquinone biosynthesis C-methylase UbiE
MSTAEDFIAGYFQLMGHNGAAHVYREALRAGILGELADARRTAADLAERCRCAQRPTELLLDALSSLGLVTRVEDHAYALTSLGSMLLCGSYRNLGDEYWSHLPAFLASGKPMVEMDDVAKSEAHYQSQAALLGWMLSPAAARAATLLRDRLPPAAAILDIGAGSAIWSLTLAKEDSASLVTAVDWPAVLEVALETAEQLGVSDRLTTLAGNYHDVEFPAAAYDLVILANITHLETPAGNRDLIAKSRRALKRSGRIAVIDVFPGQVQGDLNRTLYVLGLALRTRQGRVYPIEELSEMMCDCGFEVPRLLPLDVPPYVLGMLLA